MGSYVVRFKEGGWGPLPKAVLSRRRPRRRIEAIGWSEEGDNLVFYGPNGPVASVLREQVKEVWLVP